MSWGLCWSIYMHPCARVIFGSKCKKFLWRKKVFVEFLPEASFGLRVLSLLRLCVQSLDCPCDNWKPVRARITKFGPNVQNNLFKVLIVLWSNRPWPSRSNLRSKSKFTPFWACLHHNSSPNQARITKFGPEVHNTVKCHYNVVQYNMMLHASLQWIMRNINQSWNTQKPLHILTYRGSYEVSFGRILEKIDHVITAPHCTLVKIPNVSWSPSSGLHGGGWGCEVSCGGHHRPRGKTTMGSALDGAVFDIAQILAYLVHNMSRSQLYLGFGHFGWLPSFFGQ